MKIIGFHTNLLNKKIMGCDPAMCVSPSQIFQVILMDAKFCKLQHESVESCGIFYVYLTNGLSVTYSSQCIGDEKVLTVGYNQVHSILLNTT